MPTLDAQALLSSRERPKLALLRPATGECRINLREERVFGLLNRRRRPEPTRIQQLRNLPWYSINPPPNVLSGQGMIHDDERRLLYTLARDYYTGEGRILDAGTFLGSSSLALGSGLKDRGYPAGAAIDAFDLFIIDDGAVSLHLNRDDPLSVPVKANDNVRHIYERNVAHVAEYISVHEGDVIKTRWTRGSIEILFCDISKNLHVNDYIVSEWLPALIPETGILIQQDQIQQYHVWIAITMSILSDYFEFIDYTLNSSAVYRLKRPIPKSVLNQCLHANVSNDDMERHYKNSLAMFKAHGMGRYTGWPLGMVELGLAVLYGFHIGDKGKCRHTLEDIKKRFAGVPDTMWRLAQIEGHLDAGTPCPGSRLDW
jgi:hypothetical protein